MPWELGRRELEGRGVVCSAAVKIITGSQGKEQGLLGIDTLGISKLTRLAAQA